jgi:hypothetical protein
MPKNESTQSDAAPSVLYGKANDNNLGVYPLKMDNMTLALTTIDYAHHEIHAGDHFACNSYIAVARNSAKQMAIITPNTATYSHLLIDIDVTAGELLYVMTEDATISANGTACTVANNNRNLTKTSGTLVFINPTATAGSTVLMQKYFGATKSNGGGSSRNEMELILKANTKYLLTFTEQNIADCKVNYILEWYDHANNI